MENLATLLDKKQAQEPRSEDIWQAVMVRTVVRMRAEQGQSWPADIIQACILEDMAPAY